jgi:hypothetical protein
MFKLNPSPEFTCAVPLSVAGQPEPLDLQVTFRHKNKAALQSWFDVVAGKPDAASLHEVIKGWTGMQDDAGAEVPYSLSALTELLNNYARAHQELFLAYVRELTESKRKN